MDKSEWTKWRDRMDAEVAEIRQSVIRDSSYIQGQLDTLTKQRDELKRRLDRVEYELAVSGVRR